MFSKVYNTEIVPDYDNADGFNRYPNDIMAEYQQSMEEGLDIEHHKALFEEAAAMESGAEKTALSERIFEAVMNADIRSDYKYYEPNDLKEIKASREAYDIEGELPDEDALRSKLSGAWTG